MSDINIRGVVVHFHVPSGIVRAVDNVSALFDKGKITGIIGESGCGKSVLGLSILGLVPPYAAVSGEIIFDGENLMTASKQRMRVLRGREIGLIPQSPSDSLNPARTIGSQLTEALSLIEKDRKLRCERAVQLLYEFGFDDPKRILRSYPFELSGGMQQRALCAIGVCCAPRWILADEPTKGLDRQLCGQVTDTLLGLKDFGVESMLVITHDLELARSLCDVIAVMYGGEIVEMGPNLLSTPHHPYTKAFLRSLPDNGLHPMKGAPLSPSDAFPGCKFSARCPDCTTYCLENHPDPYSSGDGMVRCFLYA